MQSLANKHLTKSAFVELFAPHQSLVIARAPAPVAILPYRIPKRSFDGKQPSSRLTATECPEQNPQMKDCHDQFENWSRNDTTRSVQQIEDLDNFLICRGHTVINTEKRGYR